MTTNAAPQTLPEFCHPSGLYHADYNGNCLDCGKVACHRSALVYMTRTHAADIENMRKRLARARKPYVVKNLTRWIEDAETRLARYIAWTEEAECTCKTDHDH